MRAIITFMGKKAYIITISVFVIVIVLFFLSPGCQSLRPVPPPVSQSIENVISIELLDTHKSDYPTPNNEVILYTLSEEEFVEFWSQYMKILYRSSFNSPPTECGIIAVRITYTDGSFDIIGTDSYKTIDASGNAMLWARHADREIVINLFAQYVDISLLPTADTIV